MKLILKFVILLNLFFASANSLAVMRSNFVNSNFEILENSWRSEFYTDDSPYYLMLFSNGFIQRVRFNNDFCAGVDSIDLVFKNNKRAETVVELFDGDRLEGWNDLYGINESDHCWYELNASEINLNNPNENLYVIKIVYNGETFYLEGYRDSLIPGIRLKRNLDGIKWMSLGGHGATPVVDGGVFYKLWEPVVDNVHLFLNGNSTPIEMRSDFNKGENLRSFVSYLPNSVVGDEYYYKFLKNNKYLSQVVSSNMLPSAVKVDPMAKEIVYDHKGGKLNGYKNPRGRVSAVSSYDWEFDHEIINMSEPDRNNRIIYQVWPLTFNPKTENGKYVNGTFYDIIEKIDYIDDLGVNVVELLPVHESKFYASWGYALDSILAIEKGYGDERSLKDLSDSLHSRKIQLILDVVLNHVNNSLIRDPIDKYNDKSKFFDGSTDWGPRPRFASIGVQKWISDSLISLIRDYHIDGFRFDMTKYIYNLGGSPEGYEFLQELNYILKQISPNIYLSAEELPDNVWVTKPQIESGLGFDSQWNDKFKNFFEQEFVHFRPYNQEVNLSPLLGALYGHSNHIDYGTEFLFGSPLSTVNYLGSHDFIGNMNPILRIVSDYNFYEQVDNNYFSRVKPLEDPVYERFTLIHNEFNHSVGRAAYGILFSKPGAILFYQGEELANDINIENEWSYVNAKEGNSIPSQNVDINRFVGSHKLPWEYLNPYDYYDMDFLNDSDKNLFIGYHQFFKDMIKFRRDNPQINLRDAHDVQISNEGSIITYQIDSGNKKFFVVVNFGTDQNGVWVNFPRGTDSWWTERFNSASARYSGNPTAFHNVIALLGGRANHIRVKSNSILIFERSSKGHISIPLYLRGSMNNWGTSEGNKLIKSSEQGDIYSTTINVDHDGMYEFKVASSDWNIEFGNCGEESSIFHFGEVITGHFSNLFHMENIKVELKKGRYRFLINISDFKFSYIYLGNQK